ncbi:putative transglutaminase-like cysteine proteinase [Campylobacter pinnipediorum subsp. caledonicus]|uniref:transglutaminase-like cysteine peptidase n=1 Tax=Campylobacter pinnipediorum TaxID=1965231 RepID=UPI000994B45E|nr:transglutaminase-like cysteine peptidase [Campylobacter pinnipediorum]AQW86557.1 putative transglutaminase-like cysteine proteinase [Campylobacter pinnipediorum subsp. caledonicus]
MIKFLFLFFTFIYANSYELSDKILSLCGSNTLCKNILNHYAQFMNKTKNETFDRKLELVNSYINTIMPRYDDFYNKNIDTWSTRSEFLRIGGGDCEEYAISKQDSLKDLGVESSSCLLVVEEKMIGGYHMVLALWKKDGEEPVILDNLSFRILPISKRYDLKPMYCLMNGKYFKFKNHGKQLEPINIRIKSYEQLLQKQTKEKFWKN